MTSLPTLRRKIFRSFGFLIGLYAVLGFLLLASVRISTKTTPKMLHLNYDSISAANRMSEAWNALQFSDYAPSDDSKKAPRKALAKAAEQFEEALRFEESNITEPGEREAAQAIRKEWDRVKAEGYQVTPIAGRIVREKFRKLIDVNELGMFGLAQYNERLSDQVLIGTLIYFLLSLVVSIFFADNLAQRLSRPLKSIAEALHRRPGMNRKLKLPEPTNLEVLVLTSELQHLWERLSETDRLNVTEIVKQKTKLETLLESVEDGLLVLDEDGSASHCNAFFAGLIGLKVDQVVGSRWTDLNSLDSNYLKLRTTLRPEMPEGQQVDLDWKQTHAYFSARSRKIASEGKGAAGTLFLIHDITEKKQREKFRAEFIDLLSHELKTPLQSLGTASELLSAQKKDFSEDTKILIDTVAEDVERIRAVAQEFVQVTQSHSKILKLKMDLVPLNQVLSEWMKPFSLSAKDRGVQLEYKQEGSEVIWANLDVVKFPWVISNLLANAVRFSPKGGVVSVLLTDRSGAVEVRIRDSGPGVAEAEESLIFEPFFQGSSGTAARGLFGIGLTIAKEVVEAHEGRIEYHRVKPQGSEFRVLLPFPPIQYGGDPAKDAREPKSWTH